MNRRIPETTSTLPVNISYDRDAPIDDQSTPIGERSPYVSSRRLKPGADIWSGISFTNPYEIIVAPKAKRRKTRNHLATSRSWRRARPRYDQTAVTSAAAASVTNTWT